jgi:hemerythrin-like metal-binding protein
MDAMPVTAAPGSPTPPDPVSREQQLLGISKLAFEITLVGSTGADLDGLLQRLFGILEKLPLLQLKPKGAILLFNPRGELVQVAQCGLRDADSSAEIGSELDGIAPEYRPAPYATSWAAERGHPAPTGQDERFLVLPLSEDERPLGETLLFIHDAWSGDAMALDFLRDLARALSSLVTRCLINETLQVREMELEEARTDAIRRLGTASEYRDNETGMHVMRMTHFAVAVGKALGLHPDEREVLSITAPMHDVGKIGIADAILLKPGRLTREEFDIMKTHTEIGCRILKGQDALIAAARDIALSHHEHWDGTGYPQGLKGEQIPILARICAIADVFDALTSPRPYKEAWPLEQTIDWILAESGKKFDPAVVEAFAQALPDILRIRELYRDDIIDPNQVVELPKPAPSASTYVVWDDSLSVGIDVIDAHHRYLVDLVNDLYNVVAGKLGARQVARILKALGQYAQVHFRAEERMMRHHGFSALGRQVHQHHRFEEKVKEFGDELHVNPLTAQIDMLAFLRDWLINHIRYEDSRLRELVTA